MRYLEEIVFKLWGAEWYSKNAVDGESRYLIFDNCRPVLFRTRQAARDWIKRDYGYIKTRSDLREEPHGWRLPRVVKVRLEKTEALKEGREAMTANSAERDAKIVQFANENPCIPRSRIAEHYGISRERIRQILSEFGARTRHINPLKPRRFCRCGNEIILGTSKYCTSCRYTRFICDNCQEPFYRHVRFVTTQPERKHRWVFCSKRCQGSYLGKHFSRGQLRGRFRKWNYEKIWELRDKGLTYKEISKAEGIPVATVGNIIRRGHEIHSGD